MAKLIYCGLEVKELRYYIDVWTNALGKGIESPYRPASYALNFINVVQVHGWLSHK